MPAPGVRRLPEPVRRRFQVATAMALEALVDTQTAHAFEFQALLYGRLGFDAALERYLREMRVHEPVTTAVRTRVLVALERAQSGAAPTLVPPDDGEPAEEGWRRFSPEALVRGVRERQRKNDETERLVDLALARAEEAVIATHVDNAITFAALLEPHLGLKRAVQEYVAAVGEAGSRGQAIFQRTMARLADVHLPPFRVRPELAAPLEGRR